MIEAITESSAIVFTDQFPGYRDPIVIIDGVNQSKKQWVNGEVYTNGIESFWARLKCALAGT